MPAVLFGWPSGWPTAAHLAADLGRGLDAARRLEAAEALTALEAVAAAADTPRLTALRARLLLRLGRATAAGALVARLEARAPDLERGDQLLVEALRAELGGRRAAAAEAYAVLGTMRPHDVDLALAWWETDPQADSETLDRLLETRDVPVERRLLLTAQAAGRAHDRAAQLSRADAALLASTTTAPVIAALARLERAAALSLLGDPEAADRESRLGAEALLARGEILYAFDALRGLLKRSSDKRTPDRARTASLSALLESFDKHLTKPRAGWQDAELAYARGRLLVLSGDAAASLEVFTEAAERFRKLGSPRALEARRAQADASISLGLLEQAQRILAAAIRDAESQGNLASLAALHATSATASAERGRPQQAADAYKRALGAYRKLRTAPGELQVLAQLAELHMDQGEFARALQVLAEARPLARRTGVALAAARLDRQQAAIELLQGNLEASRTHAEQALGGFEELAAAADSVAALLLLSTLERYRADLANADTALSQAAELGLGSEIPAAGLALERGRLLRERGQIADARATIAGFEHDATASAEGASFDLRLFAARLDLDSGQSNAAERRLWALLEEARQQPRQRLAVHGLLAEALLAQGEIARAQGELRAATELLPRAPDLRARLLLAITQARLERTLAAAAAYGSAELRPATVDDGRQRLRWVADTASEKGALLFALEARVELQAYGSDPSSPGETAASLARELERRQLGRLRERLKLRFP